LIGSIRRECTDHLLVFNAEHLRRTLAKYATYYNEVRTHVSLGKDAPCRRPVERFGDIIAQPILGGLHHRYARIWVLGSHSFDALILAFIVVVIGGLGSLQGALVGALIVSFVRTAGIQFFPEIELAVLYLIAAVVLLVKPTGLFGDAWWKTEAMTDGLWEPGKAQRCGALHLPQGHPTTHDRGLSDEPVRWTTALELA
jgi:Integrase core domain